MSRHPDFSPLSLVQKDGLQGLLLDAQRLKLPMLRCTSIKKPAPFNPPSASQDSATCVVTPSQAPIFLIALGLHER